MPSFSSDPGNLKVSVSPEFRVMFRMAMVVAAAIGVILCVVVGSRGL